MVELDRPKRAQRRNGAKSDPLDAVRAARESLARARLGTPRSGGDRQALSVLLAARRSAVTAATEAQQQVFSLVIAAPEPIRARFRGQKLPGMLATAAALRVQSAWDVETTTTVMALRSLARRFRALSQEAAERADSASSPGWSRRQGTTEAGNAQAGAVAAREERPAALLPPASAWFRESGPSNA